MPTPRAEVLSRVDALVGAVLALDLRTGAEQRVDLGLQWAAWCSARTAPGCP
jgi:hypothetical protein